MKQKKGMRRKSRVGGKIQRSLTYNGFIMPAEFTTNCAAEYNTSVTFSSNATTWLSTLISSPITVFGSQNCSGLRFLLDGGSTTGSSTGVYFSGIVNSCRIQVAAHTTKAATGTQGAVVIVNLNGLGQASSTLTISQAAEQASNFGESGSEKYQLILPAAIQTSEARKELDHVWHLHKLHGLTKQQYRALYNSFGFYVSGPISTGNQLSATVSVGTDEGNTDATLTVSLFIRVVYNITLFDRNTWTTSGPVYKKQNSAASSSKDEVGVEEKVQLFREILLKNGGGLASSQASGNLPVHQKF